MEKTAVIIGATGAVGREISNEILSGEYYDRIYILGRSSINKLPDNSRLTKIIIDFENINFDTSILEEGEYITKRRNKENNREIYVEITEASKNKIDSCTKDTDIRNIISEDFTDDDLKNLTKLLDKFNKSLI